METFAKMVGFPNVDTMADAIHSLKVNMGMRYTLAQAGIADEDVPILASLCRHPNLDNNPTKMTQERLVEMFLAMR